MSVAGLKTAWTGDGDEKAYLVFLDSLPFPVWLADERGRCVFQNKAGLAFLGKKPDDVLAEDWAGFVHPDDASESNRSSREPG